MTDKYRYRERRLRAYPPITLEELAAATDPPVSVATISRLETNGAANPTERVTGAIERALTGLIAEREKADAAAVR